MHEIHVGLVWRAPPGTMSSLAGADDEVASWWSELLHAPDDAPPRTAAARPPQVLVFFRNCPFVAQIGSLFSFPGLDRAVVVL